ncbi:MAG: Molybdopterin converting factor, subunit 1 [Deltaproteobacteria bacterium]|nr:Molybdopterin converting factor, subunit 1 [Deltaproteobacteria bacterium]
MNVRLRFFASVRERLRRAEADWELPEGATVDDLWQALSTQYPQLQPLSSSITFAVNREYVARDHQLAGNDEIAIIPPVSGGVDVSDRIRAD